MQLQTNQQLDLAYKFLQYTNENIFLTGKAGTGKTTFLKELRKVSPKRMIVVAPTGVAAINAGGVTIHSFFQLSFGPQIPEDTNNPTPLRFGNDQNAPATAKRFNKEKINIIRSMDLLVIDEISMVRADILDAIDGVLRRFKNRYKPFGGVQLLMIGDLQQLSPVIKEDEWNLLRSYYDTAYFFSSRALKLAHFTGIELKHIFRQKDQKFIDLLNNVRENTLDRESLDLLNSCYKKGFEPRDEEGYITLTTHNYQSRNINDARLSKVKSAVYRFRAKIEGSFPEYSYPTDEVLELKAGAQVMFVKNDPSFEKRYYNGKIGKITRIDQERIEVLCAGDREPVEVERSDWENARYSLNSETNEIEEEVIGRFIQYPLKLAWAITIHKSQGLTFEKAIIDARQSFAHGQVYVALSRCKSLQGLVLSSPLDGGSVINDQTVLGFTRSVEENEPGEKDLHTARKKFEMELFYELFDFKKIYNQITYLLKVSAEHAPLLMGNLVETLQLMQIPLSEHLINVSEKFTEQLRQLLKQTGSSEENQFLQERLIKAGSYYSQKLEEVIFKPLESTSFHSDNRAVSKQINDAFTRFENELEIKRACFEEIKQGFKLKDYLDVRAKAAIEKPKSEKRSSVAGVATEHPDFFKQLLQWRDQKADELDLVISKIVSQKVLVSISNEIPFTAVQLKKIKGMGGIKMQYFGKDLLGLCLNYRKEQGMELPVNAGDELEYAGLDSKSISFKMYKAGHSLKAIQSKRKLAATTIEGHLAHFITLNELDVFELVDRDTYKRISELVQENPVITSSEIMEKMNNQVTYGEIKMTMADLGK